MPAGRCCSKSAISLWDRHPRRLVQKNHNLSLTDLTLCSKRSFWAFNCFNSRLSSWGVSNTLPVCYSNALRHCWMTVGDKPYLVANEFIDSFSWRAAIATFALNEASNLRCLPIILKILLAKVLLFFSLLQGRLIFREDYNRNIVQNLNKSIIQ